MKYFLGLDIGTSGVKAVLVAPHGPVKAEATQAHPLSTPKPGWAEQDPHDWWRASLAAISKVLSKAKIHASDVAALGLSGQMHSSVFLDAKGKVIRPALLWCDGRTTPQCQAITRKVGEGRLKAWVGNPALEGFTLPKVLWLKENEPSAFKRLAKVVLAKDYIRYCLTGELMSEPSDASATLMYDVAKRRWSDEMMKAVGLSMSLLPGLGGSAEILGRLSSAAAKATGLAQGTPVAGGGADNACGAVGVGLLAPGDAVVSWGTSGTVLAPTLKPKADSGLRVHSFCHAVPDTWYAMGVMLTAGGAFAWHRENWARELAAKPDANLLLNAEAAKIAPGSEGLSFLPYLQGERSPHRDASARGALVGLSLAHSRAHVSRAVMEGICFGLRDSLEILKSMGLPLKQCLLTGGGAKSPLLRRMQADIYGLPVRRVNREEGPAYGAALLGAVAAGAFKSVAAACAATLRRLPLERPDSKRHKAYAAPYARFKSLYPALKGHF
jgi:xylulokinase